MKNSMKSIKELYENILFSFNVSYKASRKYFFAKSICLMLLTILPIVNAWIWKNILNAIVKFEWEKKVLLIVVLSYALVVLFIELLNKLNTYLTDRYEDEVTFYLENEMIDKISRMDISFFDSSKIGDKVQRVRSSFWTMNNSVWLCFEIVFGLLSLLTTFSIVFSTSSIIGIIALLLLLPRTIIDKKHLERQMHIEKETLREQRMSNYFEGALYDNNIQFEAKVNDSAGFFINKYNEYWNKKEDKLSKENKEYNVKNIFGKIISYLSEIIVVIYSVIRVIQKKYDIGTAQYYISVIQMMNSSATIVFANINEFIVHNERLKEVKEFLNLVPVIECSGIKKVGEQPSIEFKNVYFKYPNTDRFILENCNFKIEKNEKIGLIGLNGAGKSTLIKLIFRFYDVTKGEILVDGFNIREYDIYSLRNRFGVLFQDYVTYCLPMREIIALSNFSEVDNDKLLDEVCELSGANKFINQWENKYDTVLGRFYADNGKSLSGGQWQIVGLARAYFKKAQFMILDEPSAALDPISEDKIFAQLYEVYKKSSALVITHRLSNVIRSDRILVLEDGYIVEQGTHKELILLKGRYAELFDLQASKYTT